MEKKQQPKKWHTQHAKILKSWGETSSCYRYLHFQAYLKYKSLNMHFSMPIIVISTVTGTANFAQETFPDAWAVYVPLCIGGLNLFAAIFATVAQFLKISELMEAHRVASMSYGKLARDIKLELSLPILDRRHAGDDFINRCSTEYDRLIEQSPPPPASIIDKFEKTFNATNDFEKPEISQIKPIVAFDQLKENVVTSAVKDVFKKGLKLFGKPETPKSTRRDTYTTGMAEHVVHVFDEHTPAVSAKDKVMGELKQLRMKNLVSVGATNSGQGDPVESVVGETSDEVAEVVEVTDVAEVAGTTEVAEVTGTTEVAEVAPHI